MPLPKKIIENSFFLLVSEIISKLSGFLIAILIARELGELVFGGYNFGIDFTFFFVIVTYFGFNLVLMTELTKNTDTKKLCNTLFTIKSIIAFFVLIAMILIIKFLPLESELKQITMILGLGGIANSYAIFFRHYFIGKEEMKYDTLTVFLERISVLIAAVLAIYVKKDIVLFCFAYLCIQIAIAIVCYGIIAVKYQWIKLTSELDHAPHLIKLALPLFAIAFFKQIYFKIDSVMLKFLVGTAAVGTYNSAYQAIEGLLTIPSIMTYATYPTISKYARTDKQSYSALMQLKVKLLFLIIMPIIIGVIVLGEELLVLVYGAAFAKAYPILVILTISAGFMFLTRVFQFALMAIDRQKVYFKILLCGSILNIVLNLVFIPLFGPVGAAITTLISEIFVLTATKKAHSVYLSALNIPYKMQIILSSLAMGIIIYPFKQTNTIITIAIAIGIYSLLIIATKAISINEIKKIYLS